MTWYEALVESLLNLDRHIPLALVAITLCTSGVSLLYLGSRASLKPSTGTNIFSLGLILTFAGLYSAFIASYAMTR